MITPKLNSIVKQFTDCFKLSPNKNESILATCFNPCYKLRWILNEYDNEKKEFKIYV